MQSKSKSLSYIQYASASLINAKHLLGYHKNVKSLQSSSNQQHHQQQQQKQQQQSSATKNRNINNKLNIYKNRKVAQMSTRPIVVGDTNSLLFKTTHNHSTTGYYSNIIVNKLKNNSAVELLKSSKLQSGNGFLLPNRMLSTTAFTTTTSTTGISSTNLNEPQQTWSYHVLPSLYSIYQKVSFHLLPFFIRFQSVYCTD